MDMVVKTMRERARCISLLTEKYPGLPYYDQDTLPVMRLISGVLNNIPFDFDYNKRPKYSLEERMRAHRWEKVCEANSYLSYILERDLDWMYEIGESYYHAEHIDEFESCSAMFNGELHTFRYMLSELEKENSNLFCFSNYRRENMVSFLEKHGNECNCKLRYENRDIRLTILAFDLCL